MKRMIGYALVIAALGTVAQADALSDSVVADLLGQGYDRIEVSNGPTQMKVEAIQGSQKVEMVYDRATGEVLKQETQRIAEDNTIGQGVTVRTRSRDFYDESDDDGRGSSSPGTDDDSGSGSGNDDDDDDSNDDDDDDDSNDDDDDDDSNDDDDDDDSNDDDDDADDD